MGGYADWIRPEPGLVLDRPEALAARVVADSIDRALRRAGGGDVRGQTTTA